jgi:hypothetical protein
MAHLHMPRLFISTMKERLDDLVYSHREECIDYFQRLFWSELVRIGLNLSVLVYSHREECIKYFKRLFSSVMMQRLLQEAILVLFGPNWSELI